MKHSLSGPLILALSLALSGASVPAARAADVSYDLAFNSAYIWRGITFTDGAVFQPSVTTSHDSGFSFNVWGNMDLDDVNGLGGEFQETDLTVAYGWGNDAISAEIGLIEYLFPNGVGAGTREVYFSLGFEVPLAPTVSIYYDFDEVDDYYASFGVEYGNELSGGWSYALGALAGYAGDKFAAVAGGTDAGFFNGEVNLTLSYEQDNWSAGGFVAYTDTLDSKVLPDQPVDFYGGVFLGLSF
jgi:uncharacterized protein (TIGR02001 family)